MGFIICSDEVETYPAVASKVVRCSVEKRFIEIIDDVAISIQKELNDSADGVGNKDSVISTVDTADDI